MGYYSSFNLTVNWEPKAVTQERVLELLNTIEMKGYCKYIWGGDINYHRTHLESVVMYGCFELDASDTIKWYEMEEDMERLSKQFPEFTFLVDVDGEERDDCWQLRAEAGDTYTRHQIYSWSDWS